MKRVQRTRHPAPKKILRLEDVLLLNRQKKNEVDEVKFSKLVEHMNEAVWMGDSEERTIYANPKFCQLMGYSLSQMVGRYSYDFWTDETAARVREVNQKQRKKGISSSYEGNLKTRTGNEIPVLLSGTPLPNGGTIGIMTDLRDIRAKEAENRAAKKLFDDLVESSPAATFVVDRNHNVVYWNRALERLSGLSSQEMIGTKGHWKLFYRRKRKIITDYLVERISTADILDRYKDSSNVTLNAHEDGVEGIMHSSKFKGKWFRFLIRPLRNPEGQVVGAVETIEDVTEQRTMREQLENRMREFQVLYRVLAHTRMVTPLPKVLKGILYDIIQACDETGPARARLSLDGREFSNLKRGESFLQSIREPIRVVGSDRGFIELGYAHATRNHASLRLKYEKKLLHAVAHAIGKHVESRELTTIYRKLIQKSPVGIFILEDGRFQFTNPKFNRLFRLREGEAITMDYEKLIEDPSSLKRLQKNPSLNGVSLKAKGLRKGGSPLHLEVTLQRIESGGYPSILGTVKDVTKIVEAEERMKGFNNELKQKIAEKTRDLRRANQRLQSLNEMKDEFIAVTSHELRSPLTAIRGYLSFMVDDKAQQHLPPEAQAYFARVYDNVEVLNNLVNNILDVSRIDLGRLKIHRKSVSIASLLKSVISGLGFQAEKNKLKVEFANHIPQKDLSVWIDSIRMRQVFSNILENAIKYSNSGTTIRVDLRKEDHELVISIADRGVGIPKSQIADIFDKFKQVHCNRQNPYGGAGLGLFIAKKLVELHKGSISVDSEVGKGTVFAIRLPLR